MDLQVAGSSPVSHPKRINSKIFDSNSLHLIPKTHLLHIEPMRLEEFKNYNTLDTLMYLERFVCQKFHHSLANYSEVSPQYQPQNVTKPFSLPLVNASRGQIRVFGKDETLEKILKIGFPVHPDTTTDFQDLNLEKVGELSVLPTCSTRTLITTFEKKPNILKSTH